jgi:hypothetical protein
MEQDFKKLELDLKTIKAYGLSITEYLYLFQLYLNYKEVTSIYFKHDDPLLAEVNNLFLNEWIVSSKDLSNKGLGLFESEEDMFDIFYNTFPQRVPSGRPLRTMDLNSKAAKVTHKKWIKEVNKSERKKVINILKKQIDFMTSKGNLEFLNNIDTWLNQHIWEKYEYLLMTNISTKLKNEDL